ncbi:hypothetical protein IWW55_002683 [Coemansia sp. RSA 2706]|nr:hypothetical protein IWW55_002683 [Coemansia sp. RSA 2706]KAJ2307896.1 hypothetical protein IWW54_004242 [Coemansia sp. RSA 2705]KAJ2320024.1 hypothetical protein IWW52_001625 [Coemansia sp. RSA 2704]KAJ2325757.1 hypothetical protein IWW51_002630 [Coemansia sp. RSA 2702]
MTSTNPNSRFISEAAIEEARQERSEAWKRAYESGTAPEPSDASDYDPRTLYERLQEQRAKKTEALAESRRFANQIQRLDDDDIEFIDTVDERERQKQLERRQEERAALAAFNERVAERSTRLPATAIKPSRPAGSEHASMLAKISGSVRRRSDRRCLEEPGKSPTEPGKSPTEPGSSDDEDSACKRQKKSDAGLLSALASYASDSESDSD